MAANDIDLTLVDDTEFEDEEDVILVYKEMERLKAHYVKVAIHLGVPPDIVDDIKENNPRDCATAFNDVLKSWIRQEHNVGKFGVPCWRNVVKAAIGAGNKLQAKKIAKNHPVSPGVNPVKRMKSIEIVSAAPPPMPSTRVIEFNALDKRTAEIDSGGKKKVKVEMFDPFNIDRKNYQPIRFSFGLVNPKGGVKSSVVGEYNMKTFPHGIALIINNEVFAKQAEREGTSIDERNLTHAFRFLGYKVEVHRNLNSKEMLAIMEDMGKRSHANCDSFVCCILSHGKEGQVYGTDSLMVPLDDLAKKIDANSCPSLGGKPKLFFLQACRGKMKEDSVRVGTDSSDMIIRTDSADLMEGPEPIQVATEMGTRVATDSDVEIPVLADFFFGYATPLGFVAWRDLDHGSWYVSELCKALCEISTYASLDEMMTRVRYEVGRSYENIGYRMSPETTNRLQKNVYF